ncbi:MAG: ATP-binding cassette domain-containing protein [Clostridia bacterium]
MITAQGITLQYGGRELFKDVNAQFVAGNCYGLIGANGTGKSTFLKILSGELEPTRGEVSVKTGERIATLRQDHFAFDEHTALETVLMGHKRLYEIMVEKEKLYEKAELDDEDGLKLANLEGEFAELDGWNAEPDAETLLNGLGVTGEYHQMKMSALDGPHKVKVLLAQALFAMPDILLLDEPTNNLDLHAITWLEDFLLDFPNTVIVVSHDRHFLNHVCTHIVDIDYGKVQMYVGNYDFWYEYTQLATRQAKDQRKRNEEKAKDLEEFIARFSANASKSRQATSRKKLLDNLQMGNFTPSSRRYPFIHFEQARQVGNDVLSVNGLTKTVGGRKVLDQVSFVVRPGDKIAFTGPDELARTTLFQILMGEMTPDEGTFQWGVTTKVAYFPSDNAAFFNGVDYSLVDWLRQYSDDKYEVTIRGWLGRVLFSGEEALKEAKVLSGGERVRCMLAKMMLAGANVLIMDEPTNHLDLEAITALNEGMVEFKGSMLFTSRDHQAMQTVANRVIEIAPGALIDRRESYDEYLEYIETRAGK